MIIDIYTSVFVGLNEAMEKEVAVMEAIREEERREKGVERKEATKSVVEQMKWVQHDKCTLYTK